MITQFRVQNYKALRDVTLALTPLHVLIGPNDSGKTSILEAIAALCRSATDSLDQAFVGPWSGRSLVWRHDPAANVRIGASLQDSASRFEYDLFCEFGTTDRVVTVSEERLSPPAKKISKTFPPANQSWVHRTGVAIHDANVLERAIRRGLTGVQYYRWDPKMMALPVAPDTSRRFRMESSGFGLALLLDDILGFDRHRFDQLETRFRSIFPQVLSLKLIPELGFRAPSDSTQRIPMLQQSDGKGLYFQLDTGLVSAGQVSDGLLLILAYVTLLHAPEPPRVILVEEPENGIHPKRLQDVLNILRQLVGDGAETQVVLTTHSPYVLDMFRPEEVSLCRKGDDGAVTVHRLIDSKTVREQLDIFTLGEIWTAEGEERLVASTSGAGQ